jgi:hypothetical protein
MWLGKETALRLLDYGLKAWMHSELEIVILNVI